MKTGNVFVAMFDIIGFKILENSVKAVDYMNSTQKVFYPKYSTQQHSKAR